MFENRDHRAELWDTSGFTGISWGRRLDLSCPEILAPPELQVPTLATVNFTLPSLSVTGFIDGWVVSRSNHNHIVSVQYHT
jgi:hypothetical protein